MHYLKPEGLADHRQVVERSGTPANEQLIAAALKGRQTMMGYGSYSVAPSELSLLGALLAGGSPLPVLCHPLWGFTARNYN